MEIREFAHLVAKMRSLQKQFFKSAAHGRPDRQRLLVDSKLAEREVDEAAKEILKNDPAVKTLFD